jgi:hypothetical protein
MEDFSKPGRNWAEPRNKQNAGQVNKDPHLRAAYRDAP